MNWGNVVNKLQRRQQPFVAPRGSDISALRPVPDADDMSPANESTIRPMEFTKPREPDIPVRINTKPWGKPSVRLLLPYDPFDPRSEKIRTLRTELVLRHEGREGANMIAMISPGNGEGRSQIAAELAVAFAQLGRRTLLVDADLRRPAQHILFMAKNHLGLAQAIARGEQPRFRPVEGLENLMLVTAGPTPRNPLELLSDRSFRDMVENWRSNFDFVVIDTPPASRYADALVISSLVRRVLALARAGHTPYPHTKEMIRRLNAAGSDVLGAVINHF
jgi:receptor protein-tyrosine kinase